MTALSPTCQSSPSPGDRCPSRGVEQCMRNMEHSPLDTPRKNKRKLSEPRKRTDFSIKRFCPDSPGSVCSESGHSDESIPDRVREEVPETTPDSNDSSQGNSESVQHLYRQNGLMFPDFRTHPYYFPSLYYGRLPTFPIPENHQKINGINGINALNGVNGLNHVNGINMVNGVKVPHASSRVSDVNGVRKFSVETSDTVSNDDVECHSPTEDDDSPKGKKSRKNYKNMTRERRVEANARERSRVHTISAAFEGLRRAVPSYSYNQKLSKLAILRIASSYIMALSRLAESDYSVGSPNPAFAECVDNCTRTIQTEGKARRRH